MGRFIYNTMSNSFEIDDRTLAHLRIVIMTKLRRSESFMFDLEMNDGSGRRSLWISAAVPLQFHYYGSRAPHVNREWAERLMDAANSPNGLSIIPEPVEPVIRAAEGEHAHALRA